MIVAAWQKYSRKHRLVFSLLPTTHFASLMHVCSLFCSPTSDSNLHTLPRPRHVSQTRPVLLTTPPTLLLACLLSCTTSLQPYTPPSRDTHSIPHYLFQLLNFYATRHLAAPPIDPSKHFLSAHALLPQQYFHYFHCHSSNPRTYH